MHLIGCGNFKSASNDGWTSARHIFVDDTLFQNGQFESRPSNGTSKTYCSSGLGGIVLLSSEDHVAQGSGRKTLLEHCAHSSLHHICDQPSVTVEETRGIRQVHTGIGAPKLTDPKDTRRTRWCSMSDIGLQSGHPSIREGAAKLTFVHREERSSSGVHLAYSPVAAELKAEPSSITVSIHSGNSMHRESEETGHEHVVIVLSIVCPRLA